MHLRVRAHFLPLSINSILGLMFRDFTPRADLVRRSVNQVYPALFLYRDSDGIIDVARASARAHAIPRARKE